MTKEELIVELENNDVQVNIDGVGITYCNSLDKELVKAIYNLQQENKQLKKELKRYYEYKELIDNIENLKSELINGICDKEYKGLLQ